jgi:Protein of unknown function (DUF1573)
MKKLVFLSLISLSPILSFAQGTFKFEEEIHNFGTILEGEPAVFEFNFTNTGDQPIILSNVKASCGCTTPYWTREPVPPGEKGSIKASYNSKGRPGNFHKSITITSNANTPTKVLQIKGLVERIPPKPKYTQEQLDNSPVLGIDKADFNLGTIEKGQNIVKKISIKNTGKGDLQLSKIKSKCNCVTYLAPPKIISSGKTGKVEISYIPNSVKNGTETISIYSNDITKPFQTILFKANVVESMNGSSIMGGEK